MDQFSAAIKEFYNICRHFYGTNFSVFNNSFTFYINFNDVKYFHEDDQDRWKHFAIMINCV